MPRKSVSPLSRAPASELPSRAIGRPSQRPQLLDTALEMITEGGVSALTYETLAARTGVSKGGLLYHFPNKDVLLDAMTQRLVERYAQARRTTTNNLPDSPSRELKGYAIASLQNRSGADRASASLRLAPTWSNRAGKAYYAQRFRELRDGLDFERAALVHIAVEGLWYIELGGVSPFTAAERRKIVEMLLRLADGGSLEQVSAPRRGSVANVAKRPATRKKSSTN